MTFLINWKIKYKFILTLLLPIGSLLYFAQDIVLEKYKIAQDMTELGHLATLNTKVNQFIHELQREREMSILFVAEKGQRFRQELDAEIARTEEALVDYKTFISSLPEKTIKHLTLKDIDGYMQTASKNLDDVRTAVNNLLIHPDNVMYRFTQINDALISWSTGIIEHIEHIEVSVSAKTYVDLITAKEEASLEGSLLASLFTKKYFEAGEFAKFVEAGALYKAYLKNALDNLSSEKKMSIEQQLQTEAMREVEKMREVAYQSMDSVLADQVDSQHWWNMQLKRIETLKSIEDILASDYINTVTTIKKDADKKFQSILVITITIVTIALVLNYLMLMGITRPLTRVVTISQAIANGHLENEIEEGRRDEIGQLLSAFKQMQARLRERTLEDKRITEEALRINQALDNVTTGVLIADNHNKIIYINRSAQQLFAEIEESVRKTIPGFQAYHLVGEPIDIFQRRSEQQFDFSDNTKNVQRLLITIGHLKLDASLAPVINADNQRLGWVTELRDRTAEIATEQEVETVISAAAQGNFEKRIELANKSGFFRKLGDMINRNLDYNHQIIEELMQVFSAIARGDLTKTMTNNYVGSLEQLKEDVNATVFTLTQVMNEIKQAADIASQGNFNQRIELSDKHGFFKMLSETLNQILDYNRQMIEELRQVFSAIAKGDLTQTITKEYQGTLALLKDDVNMTVAKLIEVMDTVKQAAETVSHAAEEISQGNTNLSQRTEQQSASLEETAASMEQMTGTVQQSANNTRKASELSNTASRQAQRGGEVVNAAVIAMEGINDSSKRVTDIIGVIDNIAFQTNLLALNAAVEAARAGDQGRGFAVVANEVRQLAQRSASSAKEIKGLIQESLGKVNEGTTLVNNSGEVFKEIMFAIQSVTVINAEIAAAGQEQLAGIHQVNKAVNQMEEMTQQNAALVEEATASSEQMQDQAENLKKHVAFFKTGQAYTSVTKTPKVIKTPRKGNTVKLSNNSNNSSSGWEDF